MIITNQAEAAEERKDVHELAICQALLDQVTGIARENDALAVTSITVRIGPLSGVEPDLLERAFEIARSGSVAKDARLVLESEAVRIHCRACGTERTVPPNRLRCPDCSTPATSIISGDALTLASLALEQDHSPPNADEFQGVRHV